MFELNVFVKAFKCATDKKLSSTTEKNSNLNDFKMETELSTFFSLKVPRQENENICFFEKARTTITVIVPG